jgi:hypothetical protein
MLCDGKQMLKDLEASLKNIPSKDRLAAFKAGLNEILGSDPSFNAYESKGSNGSTIWAGDLGFADVFSPNGGVYGGKLDNPQQFTLQKGGSLLPNYPNLKIDPYH